MDEPLRTRKGMSTKIHVFFTSSSTITIIDTLTPWRTMKSGRRTRAKKNARAKFEEERADHAHER